MKIGFDAKRAFNNNTGLGNYSRYIISSLVKAFPEHEYLLYTPKVQERFKDFVQGGVEIGQPKGLAKRFGSVWRSMLLGRRVARDGVDIYHGLSHELPYDINKGNVKTVLTMHDLIFVRYPELYKPFDRKLYFKKYFKSCQLADSIIAISEQTRQDVHTFFGVPLENMKVHYQDCLPMFQQEITEATKQQVRKKYGFEKEFILCVGTVEKRKNQLNLIKAFRALEDNKLELVIVGRPTAYRTELDAYVQEHGLSNRVRFITDADFIDFPAIYASAKLFVYPSIFEGFGIPIIEAQNCGVPVITSTGSCFSEAGGDSALYADPNRYEDLLEQMKKVLADEDLAKKMSEGGKQNVLRFRPEVTMPQLMEVYKETIRKGGRK